MIRASALAISLLAGAAAACPAPSPELLFHSCWGAAGAELLLLPEDALPPLDAGMRDLIVSGAYTGTEARAEGGPKPVGLFVHGGRVVNPNLGRMDGILVLPPGGPPRIAERSRVALGTATYDLSDMAERRAFAAAAARTGTEVLQSHLLVVDGRPDVRPREDAPAHRRRILFTGPEGWGVWQTRAPETLHAATLAIAARLAPRMALNLDMGSFDYCWWRAPGAAPRRCGVRREGDTARLSNLLRLTLR